MHNTTAGLLLLVIAGIANSSFALPMKFTSKWAWENTWLIWSICALFLFPILAALVTIPLLGGVYHAVDTNTVVCVVLFGAGWGVAQVLFGLALDIIGIGLTFCIVLGLSAAMGSLIPLIQLHRDRIMTPGGLTALTGIALVVAGVAISAVAGRLRDRAASATSSPNARFVPGLIMAILSGICASMMNLGVAFGAPIANAAVTHGARRFWAVNAIWLPLLIGGAVPNILYCLYLLRKKSTARRFSESGTSHYWALAGVMAALWFGSSLLYGISSNLLGDLGTVVGWPVFMSLIVILATLIGIATGEWKNAGSKALTVQGAAVAVLVLAVMVLSRASL
jgi:L-rhamnose-H+ transport protein